MFGIWLILTFASIFSCAASRAVFLPYDLGAADADNAHASASEQQSNVLIFMTILLVCDMIVS